MPPIETLMREADKERAAIAAQRAAVPEPKADPEHDLWKEQMDEVRKVMRLCDDMLRNTYLKFNNPSARGRLATCRDRIRAEAEEIDRLFPDKV
jgi:hypothetical protein